MIVNYDSQKTPRNTFWFGAPWRGNADLGARRASGIEVFFGTECDGVGVEGDGSPGDTMHATRTLELHGDSLQSSPKQQALAELMTPNAARV